MGRIARWAALAALAAPIGCAWLAGLSDHELEPLTAPGTDASTGGGAGADAQEASGESASAGSSGAETAGPDAAGSGGNGGGAGDGGDALLDLEAETGPGGSAGASGQAGASGSDAGLVCPGDASADAPVCMVGLGDCEGDAGDCETVVGTSAAHCGRCGHSCLGAGCVQGQCQPIAIATGGDPRAITVVGNTVFWADSVGGSVKSVPVQGGTPTTIATGEGGILEIASDGARVFWATFLNSDFWIRGKALGASPPTDLSASGNYPAALVVHGDHVYWTEPEDGNVRRAHKILGGTETVASGLDSPEGIAVEGSFVYVTTGAGGASGAIRRAQIGAPDAGAWDTLVTGLNDPVHIALDATSVYWTEEGAGRIATAPKSGGIPTAIATGQSKPARIAVDDAWIFWTNNNDYVKQLSKCPGSKPSDISSYVHVGGLALSADSVFFTSLQGEVTRVAK